MYLWTSEAVSSGHPDKVADQIADSILDAYLQSDPASRVACEVTICRDLVLLTGEMSSQAVVDAESIARSVICKIGYDRAAHGMNGNNVEVINRITTQSPQIAAAVAKNDGEIGAGDQGMMFGFACNETPAYMPLAHHLSFEIINLLRRDIDNRHFRDDRQWIDDWNSVFLPDAKSQVTLEYNDDGRAVRVHTVVISTCHKPGLTIGDLNGHIKRIVVDPMQEKWGELFDKQTKWLINPAGLWTIGGPAADTGLSGRKIVVDNYGSDCPIGGGSFSGKDPTKVDRSGAYAARFIAKNLVAAKWCKRAQVQIAYAIGVVEPVSIRVQTDGSGPMPDNELAEMVRTKINLTPKGIIDRLQLRRPIYADTASGGHFGRSGFSWEEIDPIWNNGA
jgi:S-adenosylmethionine synthetase